MWFTALFFCLPVGVYVLCQSFRASGRHRTKRILLGLIILLLPFCLLVLEIRNLSRIETRIVGKFLSENDSLFLKSDGTYQYYAEDSCAIGDWYLTEHGSLVVILELVGQPKETVLEVKFNNEELELIEDRHHQPRNWVKK